MVFLVWCFLKVRTREPCLWRSCKGPQILSERPWRYPVSHAREGLWLPCGPYYCDTRADRSHLRGQGLLLTRGSEGISPSQGKTRDDGCEVVLSVAVSLDNGLLQLSTSKNRNMDQKEKKSWIIILKDPPQGPESISLAPCPKASTAS